MARAERIRGALTKTVAFRLTRDDYAAYQVKFATSGMSQSAFFRQHVLANTTTVIARPRATADRQRLLYLVNKAGNNLNQLVHRAHKDHAAGVLNAESYMEVLAALRQLSRWLSVTLDHVD